MISYFLSNIYKDELTSISQLFTDHGSISGIPFIATNCPPLVIDAHLHSTFILIGASHQTNITIGTVSSGIDYELDSDVILFYTSNSTQW